MKDRLKTPPYLAKWLFSRMTNYQRLYHVIRDVDEVYYSIQKDRGYAAAILWYWTQSLASFYQYMSLSLVRSAAMIKNYLKIALRNLQKNKLNSIINITGLVLGFTLFLACGINLINSLVTDKFHKDADKIFCVVQVYPTGEGERHLAYTSRPLLSELAGSFPDVEESVQMLSADILTLGINNQSFYENGILFVDPNFLQFFTFDMIAGDPGTALSEPNSIVISESRAVKYFGNENPIGKTLTLDNKIDLTVKGIIKSPGLTSSIMFDMLISMDTGRSVYSWFDDRNENSFTSFVKLRAKDKIEQMNTTLPAIIDNFYTESTETPKDIYLHPLLDIRLNSDNISHDMGRQDKTAMYNTFVIGLLLLSVVSINCLNLFTARSMDRAKEIGMRKVVGARKTQLVMQFLGENLIYSIIAIPFVIVCWEILWREIVAYLGVPFNLSILELPHLLYFLLGAVVFTGILSGLYPAFFLSAFRPIQVLKGGMQSGKEGAFFRKTLVVVQFIFSIILIVVTLHLKNQFDYTFVADLGYNKEDIFVVKVEGLDQSDINIIKNQLEQRSEVIRVTSSANLPGNWNYVIPVLPEGSDTNDESLLFAVYGVDYNFIEAMQLRILQGRSFSKDHSDQNEIIINEFARQQLPWDDPIGRIIKIGEREAKVTGIVDEFHFKAIDRAKTPSVLYLANDNMNYVLAKFVPGTDPDILKQFVENWWKNNSQGLPLDCFTFESHYYEIYKEGNFAGFFLVSTAIVSILFSCFGLFGLVSYSVIRKTKEIGIRKTLGSSEKRIVMLLSWKFVKMSVISMIIGFPSAYFLADTVLQSFAYRISVSPGILFISALLTCSTIAAAVLYHTVKAARANPVDSLRYE